MLTKKNIPFNLMSGEFNVEFDPKEFDKALEALENMGESIDRPYVKKTMRRKLNGSMKSRMQAQSPSTRLLKMIGVTSAKKKTPFLKVGVVKNDSDVFEDITSYGLAAILEYKNPEERYAQIKKAGIVVGRASRGIMSAKPWLRRSFDAEIDDVMDGTEETVLKKVNRDSS